MTNLLQSINTNYSAVLTLFTSILMVIVTIIYVWFTKKQADYARKSVETLITQIKVDKQPCIVPTILETNGTAFNATDYVRMQLHFKVKLDNCGDSPATNIFTFAFIELQNEIDEQGEKEIIMGAVLPDFVHAIMSKEAETTSLHFETREIEMLINDLSICINKNWERIKNNPSKNHIHGPNIIIKVFYRNIMGQWYTSTLIKEIAWLEYKESPKSKKNNSSKKIILPKSIKAGDDYNAVLISDKYSPFSYHMTNKETVISFMNKCGSDNPMIDEIIKTFN